MALFVDHGAAWITTAASNLTDGLVHVPPPNLLAAILSGCERGKQRLPKAGRSGRAQTSEVAPAASWSCLALSKSLHNLSLSGYCAVTTAGASDCAVGESGMWVASSTFPGVGRSGLLAACAHKCLGCARCNFVSFSQEGDECGWYHACELPLQTKFDDTFHTLRLKASSRFLDHRACATNDSPLFVALSIAGTKPPQGCCCATLRRSGTRARRRSRGRLASTARPTRLSSSCSRRR